MWGNALGELDRVAPHARIINLETSVTRSGNEGISGYEQYRDDLVLMYFPTIDPQTGRLVALRLVPQRLQKLKLNRASASEAEWLRDRANEYSAAFGSNVTLLPDNSLSVRWTCR